MLNNSRAAVSAGKPSCSPRRTFLASAGVAAACCAATPSLSAQALPPLRFSGGTDAADRRYVYPQALLELALARAGSGRKVASVGGMTQTRLAAEVGAGRMDVLILPMSWPSNDAIMPVRVPLRRGLLGLRLLLARPSMAESLARCRTLDELRSRFTMGYGADWIDRPAFEPLGFKVVIGSSYVGLFDMLRAGRFDYFSRGVNEIWAEIDHPQLGRKLVVVPQVAVNYPLDDYFYVRRGDNALAELIGRGLQRARQDGSFAELFERYHSDGLRRSAVGERQVLELAGYPVQPGTPLELFDILPLARRIGRMS